MENITDKEAEGIIAHLVPIAMKTLKISEKAAKLRIEAIVKSGMLSKFGPPTGDVFQIAIDAATMIPQIGKE